MVFTETVEPGLYDSLLFFLKKFKVTEKQKKQKGMESEHAVYLANNLFSEEQFQSISKFLWIQVRFGKQFQTYKKSEGKFLKWNVEKLKLKFLLCLIQVFFALSHFRGAHPNHWNRGYCVSQALLWKLIHIVQILKFTLGGGERVGKPYGLTFSSHFWETQFLVPSPMNI